MLKLIGFIVGGVFALFQFLLLAKAIVEHNRKRAERDKWVPLNRKRGIWQ